MGALHKQPRRRPNRGLGWPITTLLHCPLCQTGGRGEPEIDDWGNEKEPQPLVIVPGGYRPSGVKLECPTCGLRFTVPLGGPYGLRATLERLSERVRLRTRPIYALGARRAEELSHQARTLEAHEDADEFLDRAALAQVLEQLRAAQDKARS